MTRPEAVILDWDNTLVDTWPAIHDAINATLSEFGLPAWTYEETRGRVRKSMRDSFPALFGERWEEAATFFYACFERSHLARLVALPGAGDMLNELHGAGIYLGVLSNKKGGYLRQEVEHLGWTHFFGRIVGALDAEKDKPSVESVELALSGTHIPCGERVWLVGDTDIDLECAHNAGCFPVLVREEAPHPGEFGPNPPALHVSCCQALCKLVRTL